MSENAWVTLATNDSYSLGALVLAHSLRQVGTGHRLVCIVTPGISESMREKLSSVFDIVFEVNLLDSKDEANLMLMQRPELGVTFTKLHCWRLTQFKKCVFLDADTLVLQNCDELFEREEFSAAPDVGWPDCFNSGVFVYQPSEATYDALIKFALENRSFDGGDQGLLNLYFSDWAHKDISKHLPFLYNMCSTACYSYLPAFKQFGEGIKIIHFIGATKPWLQYFNSETLQVNVGVGMEHLHKIVQFWWELFCTHVHSLLSSNMAPIGVASHNPKPNPSDCITAESMFDESLITYDDNVINFIDPWETYKTNTQENVTTEDTSPEEHRENHHNHDIQTDTNCSNNNANCNNNENYNNSHVNTDSSCKNIDANCSNNVNHNSGQTYCNANIDSICESYQASCNMDCAASNENEKNLVDTNPLVDFRQTNECVVVYSELTNNQNEENTNISPSVVIASGCIDVSKQDVTIVEPDCSNPGDKQDNGGLAGALAQITLGQARSPDQCAFEDHMRRQGWEVGNIDYLGKDRFDNIWSKISETLASAPPQPKPEPVQTRRKSPSPKPKAVLVTKEPEQKPTSTPTPAEVPAPKQPKQPEQPVQEKKPTPQPEKPVVVAEKSAPVKKEPAPTPPEPKQPAPAPKSVPEPPTEKPAASPTAPKKAVPAKKPEPPKSETPKTTVKTKAAPTESPTTPTGPAGPASTATAATPSSPTTPTPPPRKTTQVGTKKAPKKK